MVRVFTAFCLTLALCCLSWPQGARAQSVDPRDARLEVTIEAGSETPYVGEPVIATLRGTYDLIISLEKFEGIELRNFTWLQLGRDVWRRERVGGREMTVVERKLALYPQRPGRLTIGPFRHHLTLSTLTGKRYRHDVLSNTLPLEVQPKPVTNGGWWLPARDVVLTDAWSTDPSRLPNGETAVRTITITAVGQTAAHLPPPPKMIAPWLISFMAPEERTTEITRDGPVGRVKWVWRMRPAKAEPGQLKAFRIPWFDTEAREMREIVIGSQRVAFAAIAEPEIVEDMRTDGLLAGLILVTGAGIPVALRLRRRRFLAPGAIAARLRAHLPDRIDLGLAHARWRGDVAAFRHYASLRLAGAGLDAPAAWALLAPLDRFLFAPEPDPAPDLRRAARALRAAVRRAGRQSQHDRRSRER